MFPTRPHSSCYHPSELETLSVLRHPRCSHSYRNLWWSSGNQSGPREERESIGEGGCRGHSSQSNERSSTTRPARGNYHLISSWMSVMSPLRDKSTRASWWRSKPGWRQYCSVLWLSPVHRSLSSSQGMTANGGQRTVAESLKLIIYQLDRHPFGESWHCLMVR